MEKEDSTAAKHQQTDPPTFQPPAQTRPRQFVSHLRDGLRSRKTFTALKYPNYRLWFWGQMVSLFGTWMQSTAQGFLIYELTRSPVYLGYVGFATGVPSWIFTLYGGVIADRVSRRRLMIITQSAMMVLAFILAILAFMKIVEPWHIIVLTFGLGIANAFDAPARLSLVTELVDREDLSNAIALNGTMFNAATAVGPAAAGITYALFGPAWCFTINGLSFIAVIVALTRMDLKPHPPQASRTSAFSEVKEGIRYIVSHRLILTLLGLVGSASFFGISAGTLFPAWAVTILGGDATTNGLLQSARGIGSMTSALLIASLGRFTFMGRLLTFGMFLFPLSLIAFSFSRWLPLSLLLLLIMGAALIFVFNLANALVQSLVPDALRGRIMSVYSLTFFGFMPVGALWTGAMAERFSEPNALLTNAVLALVLAVVVLRAVPELRTER